MEKHLAQLSPKRHCALRHIPADANVASYGRFVPTVRYGVEMSMVNAYQHLSLFNVSKSLLMG